LELDVHSRIGSFKLVDSGDPQHDPFFNYAHQFVVFVPRRSAPGDTETQTLERIIEMAKPAYTNGQLRLVEPRFRVGVQAFVGIDTVIGRYPVGVYEGLSKLGHDTVLGTPAAKEGAPAFRVGKQSRIGSTTLLD
jgi:hypothetical protein